MQLVKTVDLPTDKNYLFCVYPHGVLSISSFITFCTEACDFEKIFPKIDRYRITLDSNFYAPFSREFYLSTGNTRFCYLKLINITYKLIQNILISRIALVCSITNNFFFLSYILFIFVKRFVLKPIRCNK